MVEGSSSPPTSHASFAGNILLADDGPDNQSLLSHYLRKAGAQVRIAENGRIAYELILDTLAIPGSPPFDLILMDMQMPELDGYGATAKIRSAGYRGPIIALTAHAMATDRDKCLQAGCSDFLSKPVSRERLLETIQRHLRRAAAASSAILQSTLDDEEIIQKLLPEFVASLPRQVIKLQSYLNENQMDNLAGLMHQLRGTGGLYGFMPITEAAARAEQHLMNGEALDIIASDVQSLIELVRTVKGYNAANEVARES